MNNSKGLRLPVHLEHKTKKFKLNELISSDKKSTQYFSNLRENGKRLCPRCICEVRYNLKSNKYWCKDCRYNFGEFTGTYLARIKLKPTLIIYLIKYFTAGYSAYRTLDHVDCDLSTIERTFRLFRQVVYDASLAQLKQLQQKSNFSKEIEIDETILDCHRRQDKQLGYRWTTYQNDNLVIGVYRKSNKTVVTFPVSLNISNDILTILREKIDDQEGHRYLNMYSSFYKSNYYTGYGMLKLIGKRQLVTYGGIEPRGDWANLYIEDFWGYMNKWLYHYKGMPKKYFPLYLKEIEFRFNNMYKNIFFKLSQLLVNPYPTYR